MGAGIFLLFHPDIARSTSQAIPVGIFPVSPDPSVFPCFPPDSWERLLREVPQGRAVQAGPEGEVRPAIPIPSKSQSSRKSGMSASPASRSSVGIEESRWSRIRSYLRSYFYIPEEGFRIPLKLLVSVTTAVIAVYQVALLLLLAVVPTIRIVRAGMTKDVVVLLVQLGLVPSENPAVPGDMEKELGTVRHYLWALEGDRAAGSAFRRGIPEGFWDSSDGGWDGEDSRGISEDSWSGGWDWENSRENFGRIPGLVDGMEQIAGRFPGFQRDSGRIPGLENVRGKIPEGFWEWLARMGQIPGRFWDDSSPGGWDWEDSRGISRGFLAWKMGLGGFQGDFGSGWLAWGGFLTWRMGWS
uniref:Uncharacterized protein n=1 Tax=Cyanistes caeruleus TaxID=156563 RepID=A0A8C0Z816_CYACU